MRLDRSRALARLEAETHGVLSTVHPLRGADVVPCMYVVDGDLVAIPIDTVKDKASTRLERERNLEADPRAALLVEHWNPTNWSALWWVRAQLRHVTNPEASRIEVLEQALASRIDQYRERPFARLLVLEIVDLIGWSAEHNV